MSGARVSDTTFQALDRCVFFQGSQDYGPSNLGAHMESCGGSETKYTGSDECSRSALKLLYGAHVSL